MRKTLIISAAIIFFTLTLYLQARIVYERGIVRGREDQMQVDAITARSDFENAMRAWSSRCNESVTLPPGESCVPGSVMIFGCEKHDNIFDDTGRPHYDARRPHP